MVPLGFSGGLVASAGGALGKSTCAADSMVTAVVTMKMISRTRKISVSGVMLISAKTPPPLLLVIAMGKYLYWQELASRAPVIRLAAIVRKSSSYAPPP